MIQYLFITNEPDLAEYAESCGVGRIFVDLETLGKKERQGHLDTLISQHSLADVPKIKSRLKNIKLMVRVNPLHENTKYEVDSAISGGADLLMLPMFRTAKEVQIFSDYVDGRVGIIPLVETYDAANSLQNIVKVQGLSEIYIGLNDLHLDMKLDFMFEPLANGFIDEMVHIIKEAGLAFGFGGIARIGEGIVPGEAVLAEHVRLGSTSVILSRTFHRQSKSVEELKTVVNLKQEMDNLINEEERLQQRDQKQIEVDNLRLKILVKDFVTRKRNETSI
ncbi:aldolase/citrate lyase family protein [Endozoicomonas ascidiicola]|uniref:aldolase/citrate lyase family protein n=1 Tax=Endozoicomonas ascidiicola TaxID=1698521 RepID=UPI00082C0AF2|nr:aldolase/citrate lyase family protein [Endozoicomonas ascidiicola]